MKKRKILITLLLATAIVLITAGITYSFYSYSMNGNKKHVMSAGAIKFHYEESSRGISLGNALPLTDEQGMAQDNYFDFEITGSAPSDNDIAYVITARVNKDSTLDPSVVKIALTDQDDNLIMPITIFDDSIYIEPTLYQYSMVDSNKYKENVVLQEVIPSGTSTFSKDFRIRMWIDERTDFSLQKIPHLYCGDREVDSAYYYNECSEEKHIEYTEEYLYNDKTFGITFNVYSKAIPKKSDLVPGLYDELWNLKETWQQVLDNYSNVSENSLIYYADDNLSHYNYNLVIDNSITSIGDYGLYGVQYNSIILPTGLLSIGNQGMVGGRFTSIEIPNTVTSIGDGAFYGNLYLMSLNIPSSVENIGEWLTDSNYNLNNISVDSENTHYNSGNNSNVIIETSTNKLIAGCNTSTIPSGVKSIGREAFFGAIHLKSITIPASVEAIGYSAFAQDIELETVEFANPNGWEAIRANNSNNTHTFTEEELSNPSNAAKLLTGTYDYYNLVRTP